ncbi:amidase [Thozetella sp. PMI_491]|nr:amidase [Thozetella sp. PMI_491]
MAGSESATQPGWEQITLRKRAERDSKIPSQWRFAAPLPAGTRPIDFLPVCGMMTEEELAITDPNQDAVDLLSRLSAGQLTTEAVITAFSKRAAVAHQLTNCLSEIMFEEAIERAKWLDAEYERLGRAVGPLHGLPISVKDSFHVKGYDSSMGITALCFSPSEKTSQAVQILLDAGAVVIAKTTVPQTLLNADTDSIVFGRTVNPYNAQFGAGGSSGGAAALQAMGGAALSLGTDGAGSVRMPAAMCGVVGYKPSGYRIPFDTQKILGAGAVGTTVLGPVPAAGFLGRSVRDLRLASKVVADAEPWVTTPFLYPHPWQATSSPTKPRIGVWQHTDFVHLHPPVARGLQIASDRLRQAGYDIIELPPPPIEGAWELQKKFFEIQDLSWMRQLLATEPHTKIVQATGIIVPETPPPDFSVAYLHELNQQIAKTLMKMTAVWNRDGGQLDAVLFVNAPHTAVPFDTYTWLGFTSILNVIDWTGIALPLPEFVDRQIDTKVAEESYFSELDASIQKLYDPDAFHGLPLSVQLIGRRFEDEKLLALAEELHAVMAPRS